MSDRLNAAVAWLKTVIERAALTWYEPGVSHEDEEASWWRADRAFTVFFEDDALTYLQVRGPHMYKDMKEGAVTDEKFVELWRWLWTEAKAASSESVATDSKP